MKNPPLSLRTHTPWDRVEGFMNECSDKGFTPVDALFLARQHNVFNREYSRLLSPGRGRVADIADNGVKRLKERLLSVNTPEDLVAYRENMVRSWACPSWSSPQEDVESVMAIVHDAGFLSAVRSWMKPPPPTVESLSLEQIVEKVAGLMTRRELAIDPSDHTGDGRKRLNEVARRAGIHTLSWNSWLYPKGSEHWLADQLEACHRALSSMSDMSGPCLGLGGFLRLSLDDNTLSDSGGSMRSHGGQWSKNQIGSNHAGANTLRLSSALSWGALGHEWIHALDYALSGPGTPSFASENSQGIRSLIDQVDAPTQSPAVARAWLEEHRQSYLSLAAKMGAIHQPKERADDAARIVALYRDLDAGVEITSVAAHFRKTVPSNYYEMPAERLAYAYDQASHALGLLPPVREDLAELKYGTPFERQWSAAKLKHWLASPEVRICWEDLKRMPEGNSLLDDRARHRLESEKTRASRPRLKI